MKMNKLIEYIKIHIVSLEQDLEGFPEGDLASIIHTNGQIYATRHLLSVAEGMIE
jgi:hypothetical protein